MSEILKKGRVIAMRFVLLIALLLSIPTLSLPAYSQVTHDFASWNAVTVRGTIKGDLGFYLELQNRLNEIQNGRNSFIVRPALQYSFSKSFSAWLGYGLMPLFSPFRGENRIWQQALYQDDVGLWQLGGRLRLEQRWFTYAPDIAFRGRIMLRSLRYLNDSKELALCSWNELFYHLNSLTNGPIQGIDQNRFFIGFTINVSKYVQLEPGYLNVILNQAPGGDDLMSHVFAVYTNISF